MSIKIIEDFYDELRKTLSECTVQKYHAKIHGALKHAARKEIIPANPAANVEKPQPEKFNASFCNTDVSIGNASAFPARAARQLC